MMSKPSPKNANSGGGRKIIAQNRRARHDYHVLETLDAGVVLQGTEVKSLRAGKVSLSESFVKIENGEAFLYDCQISHYEQGNRHNHEPTRPRKLLLNKSEISRLFGKVREKGLTLIPLSLYFRNQWVKLEFGLCKGKQLHDKRETLKKQDAQKQIDRALRERD